MIHFNNAYYENIKISDNTIFITAIGYEHRSFYLYNTYFSKLDCKNVLCFLFDDYEKHSDTIYQAEIMQKAGIDLKKAKYESYGEVINEIINFLETKILESVSLEIHIDYSSMPRSWYCRIPLTIENLLRNSDIAFCWYSEGEYPSNYEEYPSAGIENFMFYSGKPSLRANNNRIHILGLGYDSVRSQAILTVTDPSHLVTCYAFPSSRRDMQENIKKVNGQILSQSALTLALRLDDFPFMVSKLCETAIELLIKGDVIFIPDGPKPLILAISLVTELLHKEGISCMHMTRNSTHFSPVDVTATGKVYGFSFIGNNK